MSAFKTWHIRRSAGGGAGGIATEVDSIATPLANAAQAKADAAQAKADANEAAIAALGALAGSSEALIEVKDSADTGAVKWTLANGLFEYVIPQADHGVPVGRRAAGISAYLASSDELTDIEVIHSKTTGDITVRSTGDLAVDIEIIGAAA